MADLYLIRHGQASFGSEDYDRLSDLGWRQSRWLGEYFQQTGIEVERVISGGLVRHQQTADCIREALATVPAIETHRGFDEFDFRALLNCYRQDFLQQDALDWGDAGEVHRALRQAMLAWARGQLSPNASMESWSEFAQRVVEAMEFARPSSRGATLVCTSGGPISMALSQLMGFGPETLVKTNLQMRNTAFTHCIYTSKNTYVTGFNHVPHLDIAERRSSITYS